MRKLTWKESVGLTWWLLAAFLAAVWIIDFLFDSFQKGMFIVVIIETVIVALFWFFALVKHVKDTALRCSCGLLWKNGEHCPECEAKAGSVQKK